jgi:hypothetical protein
MKGLAAPGPDDLPAIFYHTYWDIIKEDVNKAVLQVLNDRGDPTPYNQTHICLIPKKNNPTTQVISDPYPCAMSFKKSSPKQ